MAEKKDINPDICSNCGAEYYDTLGISKCGDCFYGKANTHIPAPVPEVKDMEAEVRELVEKFKPFAHGYDTSTSKQNLHFAKQCAIKHCELMLDFIQDKANYSNDDWNNYSQLIEQIKNL